MLELAGRFEVWRVAIARVVVHEERNAELHIYLKIMVGQVEYS